MVCQSSLVCPGFWGKEARTEWRCQPVAFMIAATVAPSMYAGGGASRERSRRVRPRPNRFYVNQNFCFVSAPGPILLRLRICQSAK